MYICLYFKSHSLSSKCPEWLEILNQVLMKILVFQLSRDAAGPIPMQAWMISFTCESKDMRKRGREKFLGLWIKQPRHHAASAIVVPGRKVAVTFGFEFHSLLHAFKRSVFGGNIQSEIWNGLIFKSKQPWESVWQADQHKGCYRKYLNFF